MRILLVSGIFPPDIGGPASYVPRLAEHLATSGHTVRVLTLAEQVEGHADRPYPVWRLRRGQPYLLRITRTTAAIAASARTCDVIYANGLYGEVAVAAALVARPVVAKVVGDPAWERARGRGWYDGSRDSYQIVKKSWLLRICDQVRNHPLKRCRAIIVPSAYTGDLVCGWGISARLIHVIPNAVEVPIDLPRAPPPGNRPAQLVTVGRLVQWKGIDGILHAVASIPDSRLEIVGDGPERDRLVALTQRLRIEHRVVFHGHLPRPLALAAMARADAFILNSTTEGMPHVILESMRLGVPVIATATGGIPEVVCDGITGSLVPVNDVGSLANAIRRLLADPDLRNRIVENSMAAANARFSMGAMLAATERILQENSQHRLDQSTS